MPPPPIPDLCSSFFGKTKKGRKTNSLASQKTNFSRQIRKYTHMSKKKLSTRFFLCDSLLTPGRGKLQLLLRHLCLFLLLNFLRFSYQRPNAPRKAKRNSDNQHSLPKTKRKRPLTLCLCLPLRLGRLSICTDLGKPLEVNLGFFSLSLRV
jgi:hypothetical protein